MSIQIKRSSTLGKIPATHQLKVGELAINMTDRQIYTNNGTTVVAIGGGDSTKLIQLTGGTMTGNVAINAAEPTLELHAVTKKYVDNKPVILSAYQTPTTAADGSLFVGVNPQRNAGSSIHGPSNTISIVTNRDRSLTVSVYNNYVTYTYDAINWFKVILPIASCNSIAATRDGSFHIVVGNATQYAISDDGAQTWTTKLLPVSTGFKRSVKISEDKKTIFIGGDNLILVSRDSGSTWTQSDLRTGNYGNLCMSDDGMRGIVCSNTLSNISYYTIDGGITWNETTLPETSTWIGLESSADGSLAVMSQGIFPTTTYVLRTDDGGITFTRVDISGGSMSTGAHTSITPSGNHIYVAGSSRNYAYSSNRGLTFTLKNITNMSYIIDFKFIVTSDSGQQLIGCGSNRSEMAISNNGGATWTQNIVNTTPSQISNLFYRTNNKWYKDNFFNRNGGNLVGNINLSNGNIINLAKPQSGSDAVTKTYIDNKSDHYILTTVPDNAFGKNTDTSNVIDESSTVLGTYTKVNGMWISTDLLVKLPPNAPSGILTESNIGVSKNTITHLLNTVPAMQPFIDEVPFTEVNTGYTSASMNSVLNIANTLLTDIPFTEFGMSDTIVNVKDKFNAAYATAYPSPLNEAQLNRTAENIKLIFSSLDTAAVIIDAVPLNTVDMGKSVAVFNSELNAIQTLSNAKPYTEAIIGETAANIAADLISIQALDATTPITEYGITHTAIEVKNKLLDMDAIQAVANDLPINQTDMGETPLVIKNKLASIVSIQSVIDDLPITETALGDTAVNVRATIAAKNVVLTQVPITQANLGSSPTSVKNTLIAANSFKVTHDEVPLTETNMSDTIANCKVKFEKISRVTNGTSIRVGTDSGLTNQGTNAVALGAEAGLTNQGNDAVAIGSGAGQLDQHANSVCLGANSFSSAINQVVLGGPDMSTAIKGCPEYADNASALLAGLVIGTIYRTGSVLKIVH